MARGGDSDQRSCRGEISLTAAARTESSRVGVSFVLRELSVELPQLQQVTSHSSSYYKPCWTLV